MKGPRNIPASVRTRLADRAKANNENIELVLLRYAIERLLYRLSRSGYADRFVLKGAMLFNLWAEAPYRATGDLDLLGYGDSTAARLVDTFYQHALFPTRHARTCSAHPRLKIQTRSKTWMAGLRRP